MAKSTRPTHCDLLFQVAKITILGVLIHQGLLIASTYKRFKTLIGILTGVTKYYMVLYALDFFICEAFRCTSLGLIDSFFLLDDEKTPCNSIGFCLLDKFDFESMKHFLLQKTSMFPKFETKLAKYCGMFYL